MSAEKRARELPVVARLYERQTARCTYRRASVTSSEGEPLVRLDDVLSLIAALTPPEGYVLIQKVDADRISRGDTNSPGYELSRRRIAAVVGHSEEVPRG